AGLGGLDFILHFHGFDDHDALSRGDLSSLVQQNPDDLSRHWSGQVLLSRRGPVGGGSAVFAINEPRGKDTGPYLDCERIPLHLADSGFIHIVALKQEVDSSLRLNQLDFIIAVTHICMNDPVLALDLDHLANTVDVGFVFHRLPSYFQWLLLSRGVD